MAAPRTNADAVRAWLVSELEIIEPIEYTNLPFERVQLPDLTQDGNATAAVTRSFGVFTSSHMRSDAVFGARQLTLEFVVSYQEQTVLSDLDAITVYFDEMSRADYLDGVIGLEVNPVWQDGEDVGAPQVELHIQIVVDYIAIGAQ